MNSSCDVVLNCNNENNPFIWDIRVRKYFPMNWDNVFVCQIRSDYVFTESQILKKHSTINPIIIILWVWVSFGPEHSTFWDLFPVKYETNCELFSVQNVYTSYDCSKYEIIPGNKSTSNTFLWFIQMKCVWCTESEISSLRLYIEFVVVSMNRSLHRFCFHLSFYLVSTFSHFHCFLSFFHYIWCVLCLWLATASAACAETTQTPMHTYANIFTRYLPFISL